VHAVPLAHRLFCIIYSLSDKKRASFSRKLEKLSEMFDAGKLRVEIEDVVPLEEAAKAHERVEAGHTRGKIVLEVG
jgi:NADPH:quinone reductase-like Zn-dependent oxidoreductase